MAKDLLDSHNVKYDVVQLSYSHDLHQRLMQQTGQRAVP